MNSQLNYFAAQQHNADLHRAALRERLASDVSAKAPISIKSGPIARLSAWLAPARVSGSA
jgi:hypothetical protein